MDMLVNRSNKLAINDIVTVKLVSGEEIVGKMVDRTADSIFLAKPVMISIQPMGKQVGLAFMPVLGSVADATIQIPLTAVAIRPVKTGDDVTRNYIQATTGLVTATPEQSSIIAP